MKEKIAEYVKGLLEQGAIEGFLALREKDGHVAPHLFTNPEDLAGLSLGDKDRPGDSRYSLIDMLTPLATQLPEHTLAVLVRGCDERALMRRFQDDRVEPLNPRKIFPVGFSCPAELAQACQCSKPWPDALLAGEKTPGVDPDILEPQGDVVARLEEWFATSDRCLKCFGCRNICPVCECKECTVEEEAFVPQRELPTSRNFLMTRAIHMVGRCVYCGLCEQACPADIPLKELYRLVARITGGEKTLPRIQPSLEAAPGHQEAQAG